VRRKGGGGSGGQIYRLLHHGDMIWVRRGGREGVEGDGASAGQIRDKGGDNFPYVPPAAALALMAAKFVTEVLVASPAAALAPAAA
jgi:hypothetical protein